MLVRYFYEYLTLCRVNRRQSGQRPRLTAEVAATNGHLILYRVRVCGHEAPTFGR